MLANYIMTLVTLLAIGLFLYMGVRVGQARAKFKVPAPAITGHPEFERTFRVQQNTLEGLMMFLPALWMFSSFVNAWAAAALGLAWVVGRYLYMEGYIKAADKRDVGFAIQAVATILLLAGTLIGVIWGIIQL